MIKRSPHRDASAGFTMLEALVVLVIFALVGAMAWPRLAAPSPQLLVRTAALRLAADLRSARADALRTGQVQTIIVDPRRKTVQQNADGRVRRLPKAVRLTSTSGPSTTVIAFRPDGGSSGGQFRIDSGSQHATVIVDWMTGATSIARQP